MKYAALKLNDVANCPGIGVSFFVQGCPHHCKGCFNPETWDFNKGKEFTSETLWELLKGIKANGVSRDLNILGGEPLCEENLFLTNFIVTEVKKYYPDIKIYIWTGYLYEDLLEESSPYLKNILQNTYCLIDGPYEDDKRDITLKMRGSANQRIIYLNKT